MEEQEIQSKLPSLHRLLQAHSLSADVWTQIHSDLSDLLWLQPSEGDEERLIHGIVNICDRYGLSLLTSSPYFLVSEQNRPKFFIHETIYTLVSQKEKAKEICTKSKQLINGMAFFQSASKILQSTTDENLVTETNRVEEAYKQMKDVMVKMTLQLEKSIQNEYDKSFGELLNEIFYSEALMPAKAKLKLNDDTARVLRDYKGDRFFSGKNYSSGYYSSFPKSENIYIGEMSDGKKQGYGKMFYSNRDTYEGYWTRDKTDGDGLYVWKDGGKYLGKFRLGQMDGLGKRLYSSGSYYEGEFTNGKRNGKGKMIFKNGDEYDGEWNDEDMQGRGMYKWASGDYYVGEFKKDKRDGKGTLTLSTGEIYESTWENGTMKKEKENDKA
jgi:hypothetical protein